MERSFPNDQPDAYGRIEANTTRTATAARPSSVKTSAPALWPVLARIPEVEPALRSAQKRATSSGAPSAPIDYRFDPPEVRYREIQSQDSATATHDYDPAGIAPHGLQRPAPHLRRRLASDSAHRETRNSRILPDSDLFSVPSVSLHDQVAPLVRFVVMVALFTLAGTSVLMMYNQRDAAASDEPSASSIAAQNADVPAPVAAAPTLTPAPITVETDSTLSPLGDPRSDLAAEAPNAAEAVSLPENAAESKHPYPTTTYPPAAITDAVATGLPRVQTSDDAPAIARFTGQLEAVPSRTAQHDDEPSLH